MQLSHGKIKSKKERGAEAARPYGWLDYPKIGLGESAPADGGGDACVSASGVESGTS